MSPSPRRRLCHLLPLLLLWPCAVPVTSETFVMGYLTGSQWKDEHSHDYERPGWTISAAISLAVNQSRPLVNGE